MCLILTDIIPLQMKKENNSVMDEDMSVGDTDDVKPLSSRVGIGIKQKKIGLSFGT